MAGIVNSFTKVNFLKGNTQKRGFQDHFVPQALLRRDRAEFKRRNIITFWLTVLIRHQILGGLLPDDI